MSVAAPAIAAPVEALGRVSADRHDAKALLRLHRALFDEIVEGLVGGPDPRRLDILAADDLAARVLWNVGGRSRRVRRADVWISSAHDEPAPPALPVRISSVDVSVVVGSVTRRPLAAARRVLAELWRVTRPAGRIVVIDEFVRRPGAPHSTSPMDMSSFLQVVAEGTGLRTTIVSLTSFRHPGEDLTRGAAVVLSRLGGRTP